jgi:ferredoxin/flavodoxin---NADP+ reductase
MAGAAGTGGDPLRVAIVGSGPSGFYAAEAVLKAPFAVQVDMYERLPVPFGLVRFGVAPDHPKLKLPTAVYDKIARSPGFAFYGNVAVGRDLNVAELRAAFHAVVFASGAESDRAMGIPGEQLPGSHTATAFVGWYNGHPDYRDCQFDLSQEVAVIIGQGNVAADVARMLAKPIDELRGTDMAAHALQALAESRVREIHVIGRRGPAQTKFTNRELQELGELQDCTARLAHDVLPLTERCQSEVADKKNFVAAKNVEILRSWQGRCAGERTQRHIVFHFLKTPVELSGEGRVQRIELERNELAGLPFHQLAHGCGKREVIECGLVFRSIGYRGLPLEGVPFDEQRGVFANQDGRVKDSPGVYATGWIKRGPSGIIGTNRADSVATVASLLADVPQLSGENKPGGEGLQALLAGRGVRIVNYADWLRLDAAEIARGQAQGRARDKFTRLGEMLAALA